MFEEFYHFTANPFRLTPDPRFRYAHGSYALAVETAERVVQSGEGFVVITGAPGPGKTTFAEEFCARLRQQGMPVARVSSTQVEAEDLLRLIAFGFGLDAERGGKATVQAKLERYLKRQHQQGMAAKLIIDEAQDLNSRALEELRLLSNLESNYEPLLQTLLVGQEALVTTLRQPECDQMQQRIVASCTLRPLDPTQLRGYVAHRLRCVGWRGDPRISGDALRHLHRFTTGIPRRINVVMARFLMQGAADQLHILDAMGLHQVLDGLEQDHLIPSYRMDDPLGLDSPVVTQPLRPLDVNTIAEMNSEAADKADIDLSTFFSPRFESGLARIRAIRTGVLSAMRRARIETADRLRAASALVRTRETGTSSEAGVNSVADERPLTGVRRAASRIENSLRSIPVWLGQRLRNMKNWLHAHPPTPGHVYIAVGGAVITAFISALVMVQPNLPTIEQAYKTETLPIQSDISDSPDVLVTSLSAGAIAAKGASEPVVAVSPNIDEANEDKHARPLAKADTVAVPDASDGSASTNSSVPAALPESSEAPLVASADKSLPDNAEKTNAIEGTIEAVANPTPTHDDGEQLMITAKLDDFVDDMLLPVESEVVLAHIEINSSPASAVGSADGFSGAKRVELVPITQDIEFEVEHGADLGGVAPEENTMASLRLDAAATLQTGAPPKSGATPSEAATRKEKTAKPAAAATPKVANKPKAAIPTSNKRTEPEITADAVTQWLARADQAMTRNRLTLPKRDNAHLYYRKVLSKDPDNRHAKAGMAEILRAYREMARARLNMDNLNSAQQIVDRGLSVDANYEPLLAIQVEIDTRRKARRRVDDSTSKISAVTQLPLKHVENPSKTNGFWRSSASYRDSLEVWLEHTQ